MKQLSFNKHLLFLLLILSRFESKTVPMGEVALLQNGYSEAGKTRLNLPRPHLYIVQAGTSLYAL